MYHRSLDFVKFFQGHRNHEYICGERVYRSTGALLNAPHRTSFGLLKAIFVITPFLLGGAFISKMGARFLEENEIFVPEDD